MDTYQYGAQPNSATIKIILNLISPDQILVYPYRFKIGIQSRKTCLNRPKSHLQLALRKSGIFFAVHVTKESQ
jgi:hypothetical protein